MIVMNKDRRGQRLTWRCKRGWRMCCIRTERVQKSNSTFMDTDEPIICRGLDRTAACAVGHSLSKHTEHSLPPHVSMCARVWKSKRILFSLFVDHRPLTDSETRSGSFRGFTWTHSARVLLKEKKENQWPAINQMVSITVLCTSKQHFLSYLGFGPWLTWNPYYIPVKWKMW